MAERLDGRKTASERTPVHEFRRAAAAIRMAAAVMERLPVAASESPAWQDLEEAYDAIGDLLDVRPPKTVAAPPRPRNNRPKMNGGAPSAT